MRKGILIGETHTQNEIIKDIYNDNNIFCVLAQSEI